MLSQAFFVIIGTGISEPGHGRELVHGINFIEKGFLFQLISSVQLPGANIYDTHTVMHTGTRTFDVSLTSELQKPLYTAARKHGVIDQGKYKKQANKQKWTKREYHVQNDADIAHKDVKMFFNKTQFPSLPFCCPHTKPHGVRGLSKHYHMRFDPKLVHDICAIRCISCACAECASMLYKPWIPVLAPKPKPRYQSVTNFSDWPALFFFNNCNIVTLSHKSTTSEDF